MWNVLAIISLLGIYMFANSCVGICSTAAADYYYYYSMIPVNNDYTN